MTDGLCNVLVEAAGNAAIEVDRFGAGGGWGLTLAGPAELAAVAAWAGFGAAVAASRDGDSLAAAEAFAGRLADDIAMLTVLPRGDKIQVY